MARADQTAIDQSPNRTSIVTIISYTKQIPTNRTRIIQCANARFIPYPNARANDRTTTG